MFLRDNLWGDSMPTPTPTVANNFQQPPTLTQIQQKVRRLTRSPSEAQLTTSDLNNYINTFLIYDFPEQLRTFKLHETFTFYTNVGQTEYPTDIYDFGGASQAPSNPLYNFENLYLSMNPPVYVGGFQVFFTQSREEFFNIYPKVAQVSQTGYTGNGTTGPFSGVITTNTGALYNPNNLNQQINLLPGQVLFDSIDVNGNSLTMVDFPLLDSVTGNPTQWGNLYPAGQTPVAPILITPTGSPPSYFNDPHLTQNNYINYYSGAYTVTFVNDTQVGIFINSSSISLAQARPQSVLFYDGKFVVRPSPDQSYAVNMEVYVRPDALLAQGKAPQLEEWWQYIAYGAAKKIFEDRMDQDSVNLILPEFNQQQRLCLRRTLVQNSNTRVATIYTQTLNGIGGNNGFWWGAPWA
jgi:hypothetical protein